MPSSFQLSRIFAEGWNAARKLPSDSPAGMAAINPYGREPEHSRWRDGYASGSGQAPSPRPAKGSPLETA